MKMSKQIINGQEFDVYDDGAVRYDEVQELTYEQQAQARNNIGASGTGINRMLQATEFRVSGTNGSVYFTAGGSEYDGDEYLWLNADGSTPRIANLGDGIDDSDAATVGQVKAIVLEELGVIENGTY